jgi:hypothetical protein
MSEQQPQHDQNAPLRHLVKVTLHKGRSVRANVVRLRYKRKRPAAAPAATEQPTEAEA